MLLVIRHRTMRLTAALAVMGITLAMVGNAAQRPGLAQQTVLLVGGSLGAVAGSRLLAPGAALVAAWRSASPSWLPSIGRLVGAALLIAPAVGLASAVLVGPVTDWRAALQLAFVGWTYATAIAAVTLAASPFLGASVSGALGLLAVWFGGIPPSAMAELFGDWIYLQRPVVLLWNGLPLGWRANRWLHQAVLGDALLLGTWIVVGIVLGAWGAVRVALVQDHRSG
jgi:hypothetical protein